MRTHGSGFVNDRNPFRLSWISVDIIFYFNRNQMVCDLGGDPNTTDLTLQRPIFLQSLAFAGTVLKLAYPLRSLSTLIYSGLFFRCSPLGTWSQMNE